MNAIIGVLITFLVIILVLYLINMLPIDGRAKQIVRDRDRDWHYFLAQIPRCFLVSDTAGTVFKESGRHRRRWSRP